MSTRSGKRIHNSFHEDSSKPNVEFVADSARKTRRKRLKENVEILNVSLVKTQKRTNYVRYPSDEEVGSDTLDGKAAEDKQTKSTRNNALKEVNLITPSTQYAEPSADVKKPARTTRSTRKFAEEAIEHVQHSQNIVEEVNGEETQKSKNSKKGKKKKQLKQDQVSEIVSRKKSKKKKGRKSGSMIVEPERAKNMSLNKSNMSDDSFHSAAGSPHQNQNTLEEVPQKVTTVGKNDENYMEKKEERRTRSFTRLSNINTVSPFTPNQSVNRSRKRKSSSKDISVNVANASFDTAPCESLDSTFNRSKKRKSNIQEVDTEEKNSNTTLKITKPTIDLEDKRNSTKNATIDRIESNDTINTTSKKVDEIESPKSTIMDYTFEKNIISEGSNTTFDKETLNIESGNENQTCKPTINTTFEKSLNGSQMGLTTETNNERKPIVFNTTFEKDAEIYKQPRARSSFKNTTFDEDTVLVNDSLPETNDTKKQPRARSSIKNTTFDKDTVSVNNSILETNDANIVRISRLLSPTQKISTELNNTYDKSDKCDSTFDKDKKLDVTFDKGSKTSLVSTDNSNPNFTSDKIDESRISITSDDSRENIVNMTPVLVESSLDESQITSKLSIEKLQPPLTPLKREGTFTKEESEVECPKPKEVKTPTKRMSLPSPGCTPFYLNKSSLKEKSVLNVTRSIEKSRRSSLAESLPRTTKVMFCSPVNNPAVVLQQRRKVIKSNLKGSNKSFVFDESANGPTEPRAVPRKRSYTLSDVDDAKVKRKRLADGLQHSVDRLSRPRTSSASGKLPEPVTPSKKPLTPKKPEAKIPRTRLPNFAALHQKQFEKMESLGECQERKAKRAKQLLTPTGAITVLERRSISPKENTEPEKSPTAESQNQKKEKDQNNEKKPREPSKKPETPVKSLPSLKSLNPGYTRFGFKLNLDVNPFSIPKKSDANESLFNFSTKKDNKAKTKVFSFSSKKDNTKPLKDFKSTLKREATLPSLTGTTSLRKEVAKQTVMREKSFNDRMNLNRNENRTVIKGVRTNRRFELQMRMRNMD